MPDPDDIIAEGPPISDEIAMPEWFDIIRGGRVERVPFQQVTDEEWGVILAMARNAAIAEKNEAVITELRARRRN